MDRIYDLFLLFTLTATMFWDQNIKVEGTVPTVQGWKGEDILLPCDIQEEPFAVYWDKENISHPDQKTPKAEYFDGNFESFEERFDIDKNFSLVISSLEVVDEGRYYCEVLLKNTQSFDSFTILTISSMASGHTIEECADRSQSRQSRCTYQSPSNTPSLNLTCVVSGFKPNVSMLWTEESGKRLYSVVSQQNTLFDGTYERIEAITVSVEHGRERTFVCVATGDSLNGTSTREIDILPISDERGNSGLIIGLTIGVPLALLILFLLVGKYLSSKHPECLPRKGCVWNLCWRRPNILDTLELSYEEEELSTRSSSLTYEQVQQCKEDLKAYYRMTRRRVRVDPFEFMELVEMDDIYTNLSLIERKSKRKIPMEYNDLLTKVENGDLSKRLLFQGEGGAGKTTLCAKIAWDWSQGRILQNLDMVIVISLRDVKTETSIGGIVKSYLSYWNTSAGQIDNYISANQNKVLIIFDGFDEFNEKLSENSSSEVIRILRIQEYNSCKVIVTTRPWRTDEFTMNQTVAEAYTFFSVEGFNEENLSAYIRRYFRIKEDDSLAENLICFMEENNIIRSNMAPFPIYCAMLCLMWNDFCEERRKEMQKMHTFSKIFREMISFLKEHYASKVCKNLQSQETVAHLNKAGMAIQKISELALEGLFDMNLSFPEEQFRECRDAMETCCRVGVLTIEREVITRERRRDINISSLVTSTVSFPHKLFQEYIAGLHIEYLFDNDRAKYDEVKNKLLNRPEEFRYVLYFTSASRNELGLDIIKGLMNCAPNNFTLFSVFANEGDKRDFCIDVAFESHTEEATKAVGKRWNEYRLYHSSQHTVSGVVVMVRYSQVQSLTMDEVKCGRTVSRDLAEGLCSSSVLHKVHISDSQFHVEFYKILRAEALNCQIKDLTLCVSSLDDDILKHSSVGKDFAQWVCAMPRLSKFTLKCPFLPDSFLSAAATSASSCKISEFYIFNRCTMSEIKFVSESAAVYLAEFLCRLPHLTSAGIDGANLPGTFFTTIASQASHCTVECIIIDVTPLSKLLSYYQGGKETQ